MGFIFAARDVNPFSSLAHWLNPAPILHRDVQAVLPHVLAALNDIGTAGKLATVAPNLGRELAAPLSRALEYCDTLVAGVPGLIDIDHNAFAADPLVHALFASPADIDAMLGRSMDLRDFLAASPRADSEHLYSLLAMRRHEKTTMGIELDGTTLRADVPQHLLYFTDHTLVELGGDLDVTRAKLRLAAFDSLMACFADHVKAIYRERQLLSDDRALERAHLAVLRGKESGQEFVVHTRRIGELDRRLSAVADSLQPGVLIDALVHFLASPESSLRLEPVEVCVDRSGVIRTGSAAADGRADTIGFPELVARDRRRHVVVLARFRRDDALRAVAAIRDQQARFIVI